MCYILSFTNTKCKKSNWEKDISENITIPLICMQKEEKNSVKYNSDSNSNGSVMVKDKFVMSRVNKDGEHDINFTMAVRCIVIAVGSLTNTMKKVSYVHFR